MNHDDPHSSRDMAYRHEVPGSILDAFYTWDYPYGLPSIFDVYIPVNPMVIHSSPALHQLA